MPRFLQFLAYLCATPVQGRSPGKRRRRAGFRRRAMPGGGNLTASGGIVVHTSTMEVQLCVSCEVFSILPLFAWVYTALHRLVCVETMSPFMLSAVAFEANGIDAAGLRPRHENGRHRVPVAAILPRIRVLSALRPLVREAFVVVAREHDGVHGAVLHQVRHAVALDTALDLGLRVADAAEVDAGLHQASDIVHR